MRIIISCLVIFLTACSSLPTKEQDIVIETKFITKLPPAELLIIPPRSKLPIITEGVILQSDIAKWILEEQKRSIQLENQIKGIAEFFKESK